MERVLTLDSRHHGRGTVLYSWHPSGQYLASVGTVTSLINGTNNLTAAQATSASAPIHTATLPPQQRCIWIWALNGAGAKTKDQREKAAAAAAAALGQRT